MKSPKVFLSFGFHVNMYHSYRGDSNTEDGFGRDIRIVRSLIRQLDTLNQKGIPVAASWDFENRFSLENIIPKHAPDIIENIRRRVQSGQDEVLLMSYNNGMTSVMNDQELKWTIDQALTNKNGSGLKDLFGKVSPIVRPQEMMFSPGQEAIYQAAGIQAITLFYSAIPFDAFRLFSRDLSLTEAHNPLNLKSQILEKPFSILPAINIADLIELGSLENWVRQLRRKQKSGEIKEDLHVFLNFDADVDFWTGDRTPFFLKKIPNAGGLTQIIQNVSKIEGVEFTTAHQYLQTHSPNGEISLGQDLADGSFEGYSSWSDKASSYLFWNAIQQDREIHQRFNEIKNRISENLAIEGNTLLTRSFELRMDLLSTTHFGMATPFLVKEREEKAKGILSQLQICHMHILRILPEIDFVFTTKDLGLALIEIGQEISPTSKSHQVPASEVREETRLVISDQSLHQDSMPNTMPSLILNPNNVFEFDLKPQFDLETMNPSIQYDGETFVSKTTTSEIETLPNGLKRIFQKGQIQLPGCKENGEHLTDILLFPSLGLIDVRRRIRFPKTHCTSHYKPHSPDLHRIYDHRWEEISPFPLKWLITTKPDKPFEVFKTNAHGHPSSYAIDYEKKDPRNANLDVINNHLTHSPVRLKCGNDQLVIGLHHQGLSAFAGLPMRQRSLGEDRKIEIHPFAVLTGTQPFKPSWGSGVGRELTLLFGEQFLSAAPTFNGAQMEVSFFIAFGNQNRKPATKMDFLFRPLSKTLSATDRGLKIDWDQFIAKGPPQPGEHVEELEGGFKTSLVARYLWHYFKGRYWGF